MVISIYFNVQFRAFDWTSDLSEVGLGEVRKLSSVVKDELVKLVFKNMGMSLHTAIAVTQLNEEQEAALVDPVDLFGSPHNWSKYHNDLKIFMECCLAHAKNGLPAQILVTNDHKFFSMFLRSSLAEDTLHSVVTDVLGVQEGVRVKLLGEIVHGL